MLTMLLLYLFSIHSCSYVVKPWKLRQHLNGVEGSRASVPIPLGGTPQQYMGVSSIGIPGYTPLQGLIPGMSNVHVSAHPGQSRVHPPILPVCHSPSSHGPLFPRSSETRPTPMADPDPSTPSGPPPYQTPVARQRPPLSDAEKEYANKRRKEQRAHERPYFKEMISAHAEQRQL
jgi:hypothetical protein